MKQMHDLRQMSDEELNRKLTQIRNDLRFARGLSHAGKDDARGDRNTMYIKKLRRTQARILTIQTERQLRKETRKK